MFGEYELRFRIELGSRVYQRTMFLNVKEPIEEERIVESAVESIPLSAFTAEQSLIQVEIN